ncbi:MAG TPA: biosynthetic peptidoglycan transglycosylase, partial [bacterium]|nr:biosynthetic peptidoglycan transglycosylase [bacterium]
MLVSEDDAFYSHNGFDYNQVREAIKESWDERRLTRGASTITQQLAKNLYLSPSRNPLRKIKEIIITKRLEKALSKDRILEIYLNVVEWG